VTDVVPPTNTIGPTVTTRLKPYGPSYGDGGSPASRRTTGSILPEPPAALNGGSDGGR
jgi:hypothetical protein